MKRLAAITLVVLSGCSSNDDDNPGGVQARCGDLDTVVVDGTLDGKPVNETSPLSGFAWMNVGKPSTFNGTWKSGSMHLEWGSMVASGESTSLTAATLTLASSQGARTFRSGTMVYDSGRQAPESTLRTSLTFDTGTVTVCVRKKNS